MEKDARLKNFFQDMDFPSNKGEVDSWVNSLINQSVFDSENLGKCSFIENKAVDFSLIEKILSISRQQNHWANFGPVSRILEHYLCGVLKVHPGKEVIMCKSATDALFIAALIKSINKRQTLRWVVSAFGFYSTHIGPLADSRIIDCDSEGLLSIEALKALDSHSWDGLIVTNVFGLSDDLSVYIQFCFENGKEIIIDNALGFYFSGRNKNYAADEVISFHQTKPWGMGEGGCLILSKDDVPLARSLINFGVGSDIDIRAFSCNSKLSDYSSALILQRLLNSYQWRPCYIDQTHRIKKIVNVLGLSTLAYIPDGKPLANVPVVCPKSVSINAIIQKNSRIQFGKYYQPLCSGKKQSAELFDKMLNIPCHSDMAKLSDDEITEAIQLVLE